MMMPRMFVARKLPDDVLAPLRALGEVVVWPEERVPVPPDVLRAEAARADALLTLITDTVDRALLSDAPRLRVVANMAVGYNNIDVAEAHARGVIVTNTPDVLTETTADLVFALILAAARRLPQAERALRAGQWSGWAPFDFAGRDVYGKRLGIFGMGRIGQAVARRAKGFAMDIIYHNRRRRPKEIEDALGATYVDWETLLGTSDILVVLVPYAPVLHHVIDAAALAMMKDGAILIAVSRGGIVDEAALYAALASGKLYAAGLDVYEREPIAPDHPLLSLDNVVLLPHIGSATVETRLAMARRAVQNIAAVLTGQAPLDPVEVP
ncbi:MAG: D-glycerate dehydrogenase [Hydrogenibacillus sp.]|nr:D-glycerate dehydrogenase [Hydrogenibacillus sp.]